MLFQPKDQSKTNMAKPEATTAPATEQDAGDTAKQPVVTSEHQPGGTIPNEREQQQKKEVATPADAPQASEDKKINTEAIDETKENNKLHEEKKALDKAKEFDLPEEEESKGLADSEHLPMFSDIGEDGASSKEEETKVSNDDIAGRHHAATRIADSELPQLPPVPQIVAPMSHQLPN